MAIKHLTSYCVIVFALVLTGCGDTAPNSKSVKSADRPLEGLPLTDETLTLKTDTGRAVPVRVLTPGGCKACPLIIFSHGANAAYDRYDAVTLPLAKAGYRVAIPNHTDSEEHPKRANYTPQDWLTTRIEDYNVIAANYKTNFRIAAGHSFGALIAQVAGGAEMSSGVHIDKAFQPSAVLAYSPPGPIPNYIEPEGWAKITAPSLITTGTRDIVPMMAENWELHLVSFESAPAGTSVALIYEDMDHYMNGAYGRETEATSEASTTALTHITEASISFLEDIQNNGSVTNGDWQSQERPFVEARSR